MIQNGDIVYVLSGGSYNTDPTASLGGDPSASPILLGINNLFTNVSGSESAAGYVDYRCLYIFNNSVIDTLWNCNLCMATQDPAGAVSSLGLVFNDEIQVLTVSGTPTGGSLTMSYNDVQFTFVYDPNINVWAANMQTAMRANPDLGGVVITVNSAMSLESIQLTIFTILYTGPTAGSRFQPLLATIANSLTPSCGVSMARTTSGNPINSIAPIIDQGTTPPTGIIFTMPTAAAPQFVGDLRPTDGIPIWIRRSVPYGTTALADNGALVLCTGTAFP